LVGYNFSNNILFFKNIFSKGSQMKKNVTIFVTYITMCCLIFSGCVYLVAGAAVGAVGGYAISKDTIQGDTDKTFNSLWSSSLKVLGIMGTVKTEDKQKGEIEADVDGSEVKITMEQLTTKTTRIRVSARKYLMPNISLAQKIYIKIIEQAK
jgi:hypothetical protein